MRVLVLGATGIIGQHMTLDVPEGVEPVFACRSLVPGFTRVDLTDLPATRKLLERVAPQVVVNLAGESRPDVVEKHPEDYTFINAAFPKWLGMWTRLHGARLIQTSTQAVFSGRKGPYGPQHGRLPVNEYGSQKVFAEDALLDQSHVTIVRPTFVLGVRPMVNIGRANPIELMLAGQQRQQVADRFFSPSFATDVSEYLWNAVLDQPIDRVVHLGVPVRVSRYQIALDLGLDVQPVTSDAFPGIAPRPLDTSYTVAHSRFAMGYDIGLIDCKLRYREQQEMRAA